MRFLQARLRHFASATALLLVVCSHALAQSAASSGAREDSGTSQDEAPVIALVGAEIHTMDAGRVIENGIVLIQGKRILSLGDRSLEIPADAKQIDVAGMTMTPGWIDVRSRLWLTEESANAYANDASLDVLDGIDMFSDDWRDVIRYGVTAVYVQPSGNGTLGGFGAVVSAANSGDGPEIISDTAALQSSLGRGASNNRARAKQLDSLKKVFAAAKKYQEEWDEYRKYLEDQAKEEEGGEDKQESKEDEDDAAKPSGNSRAKGEGQTGGGRARRGRAQIPVVPGTGRPATGKPSVKSGETKEQDSDSPEKPADSKEDSKEEKKKPPKKPEKDETKERLVKVIRGEIPVRLEIHNADDAYYALQLLDEFEQLQIVLEGLSDLQSATQAIIDLGFPVVLGPWLGDESGMQLAEESTEAWGDDFSDYPGTLSLSTYGAQGSNSRFLRVHVGRAIAAGFECERALRSVTIDAARLLGVDEHLGSLAPGKRADLVCFAGDPLNASVPAGLVMSAGRIVYQADASETPEVTEAGVESPSLDETSLNNLPSRFAIRSSHVLTSDGKLAARTIEVDNGRITAIVEEDTKNENRPLIDVGEAYVTPGLHSAHTTLEVRSRIDPNSQADASYVVAGDIFVGTGKAVEARVRQGFLSGLLAPGNTNPLAGTASTVRLSNDDNVLLRLAATKFCLTESARSTDRFPSSLAGQQQLIRESLSGDLLDTRLYLPSSVLGRLRNQRNEALEAVVDSQRLVLLAAESDAEIRAALDLVEQHSLRAALLGPLQLQPFVDRIAALETIVIAKPASFRDYDWYWQDLAAASRSGVPIYFSGDTAEALRLTACLAVAAGMDGEQALAALCNGPAELIESPTLATGALADIVVWSDTPLNMAAKPLAVLVAGQTRNLRKKD